ncbi:MAG: NUDIX hydrolase [Betaproteobacteria bacterium]|nr:NUDIX hydrolase [Betaproteobacteria bacterium]
MNFCSSCGARVMIQVPQGDHLPRHVCSSCQTIHYSNPKVLVGSVPVWQGQILLCRRAIMPRAGYWTMPSGFMENGETLQMGAARETFEESLARVTIEDLMSVINIAAHNQVHVLFRARMNGPEHGPTPESSEVRLFSEADIPWEDLAFRTVSQTLRHFFEDRQLGQARLHLVDLDTTRF